MFLTSFFAGTKPLDTSSSTSADCSSSSSSSSSSFSSLSSSPCSSSSGPIRNPLPSSPSLSTQPPWLDLQEALQRQLPQRGGASGSASLPKAASRASPPVSQPAVDAPWTDLRDVLRQQLAPQRHDASSSQIPSSSSSSSLPSSSPPPSSSSPPSLPSPLPSSLSSSHLSCCPSGGSCIPSSGTGAVCGFLPSSPVSPPGDACLNSAVSLSTDRTEASSPGHPQALSTARDGSTVSFPASSLFGDTRQLETQAATRARGPGGFDLHENARSRASDQDGGHRESLLRSSSASSGFDPFVSEKPPVSQTPAASTSLIPTSSDWTFASTASSSRPPCVNTLNSSPPPVLMDASSSLSSSSFSSSSFSSSLSGSEGAGRSFAAALDSLVVGETRRENSSLFAAGRVLQVTARGLSSTRNFLLGEKPFREGAEGDEETRERQATSGAVRPQRRPDGAAARREEAEPGSSSERIRDRGGAVLYLADQTTSRMRFLSTKKHFETWLPRRLSRARFAASCLLPDPSRWTETAPWLAAQLARENLRREENARLRSWLLLPARPLLPHRERTARESVRGETREPDDAENWREEGHRQESRGRGAGCSVEAEGREKAFPSSGRTLDDPRQARKRGDWEGDHQLRRRDSLPHLWELRKAVAEQRSALERAERSEKMQEEGDFAEGRVAHWLAEGSARLDALLRAEKEQLQRLRNDDEWTSGEDGEGERGWTKTGSRRTGGLVKATAANLTLVGALGRQVQDVQLSVLRRLRGPDGTKAKEGTRAESERGGENEGSREEEVLMKEAMGQLAEVALLEMKERFLTQLTHLLELTESARRLLDRLVLLNPSDSSASPVAFLSAVGHLLVLLTQISEQPRVQALPPATRVHANQRLYSLLHRARCCLVAFVTAALKSIQWGLLVPKKMVSAAETEGAPEAQRQALPEKNDEEERGNATPFSPLFLALGGLFALQELERACREARTKKKVCDEQKGQRKGAAKVAEKPWKSVRCAVGQTAVSHPEKVWAIQALASPLAAAFQFHFCRQGGPLLRLDKPEWAREFLLKQLERHEDLLYDSAGIDWVDPEDCRVDRVLQRGRSTGSLSLRFVFHFFLPHLAGSSGSFDRQLPASPPGHLGGREGQLRAKGEMPLLTATEWELEAEGLQALEVAACSLCLHVDPAEGLQFILAETFRQFLLDRMPALVFVPVSPAVSDTLPPSNASQESLRTPLSPLGPTKGDWQAGTRKRDGEGAALAGETSVGALSPRASAAMEVELATPYSGSASLFLFHLQQALDLFAFYRDQGSLRAAGVVMRDFNDNTLIYPPGEKRVSPQSRSRRAGDAGQSRDKETARETRNPQDRKGPNEAGRATLGSSGAQRAEEARGARAGEEGGATEKDKGKDHTGTGGFSLLRGLVTAALCEDEESDRGSMASDGENTQQTVSPAEKVRQRGEVENPDVDGGASERRERDTGDASDSAQSEKGGEEGDTKPEEKQEDWLSLRFFDSSKSANKSFPGPIGMLEFWITLDAAFLNREIDQIIADGAVTQPHALATFLQHSAELQSLLAFSNELVVAAVALFDAASPRVGALSQDDAIESFYKGVFGPSLRRLLETLKAAWNSLDSLSASPPLCGLLLESTSALCLYLDPQKWLAEQNPEQCPEKEGAAVFLLRAFFRRFLSSEVEALETMRSRMEAFVLLEISEHVEAAAPRLAKAVAPLDTALGLLEGFTSPLHARLQRDLRRQALQQIDQRILEEASSSLAHPAAGDSRLLLGENCMHIRNEAWRLLPSIVSATPATGPEEPCPRTSAVARLLLEPTNVSQEMSVSAWETEQVQGAFRPSPHASAKEQENRPFDPNKKEETQEQDHGGRPATEEQQQVCTGDKLNFFRNPLARVQHAAGAFWQLASVESERGGVSEDFRTRGDMRSLRDGSGERRMCDKEVEVLEEAFNLPRGVLTSRELLQLVSLHQAITH
ncbi:UNVERIFIED_CONTAM: hypothetical protein HHA_230700 [Hammondia hammondi]|eukprot:XP_008885755.1 hypothetical protein HHA_230700 [Hammondia hammondi]